MNEWLRPERCLPEDLQHAELIGRAWLPGLDGPAVVRVQGEDVFDLSSVASTSSGVLNLEDPLAAVRGAGPLPRIGSTSDLLANAWPDGRNERAPWFLAPCDLQCVKASGVTFVASLLERVIEEQARGDAGKGRRAPLVDPVGHRQYPARHQAGLGRGHAPEGGAHLAGCLVAISRGGHRSGRRDLHQVSRRWPSVGTGAEVGIHPKSQWNNPEPEIVLAVGASGKTVGATLGNDVNLRDFEGRSALLLGKAKDNNASCAIGPFIRLFDERFTMDDVRRCDLALHMQGPDGFAFTGRSSMAEISRDPLEIVEHTIGPNHQYPDGLLLFLGTMFAPTIDRLRSRQGLHPRRRRHRDGDHAEAGGAGQPGQPHRQGCPVVVRSWCVDDEPRQARASLEPQRSLAAEPCRPSP